MKNKGIGTAIIVIVIVAVAAAAGGYFLLTGGDGTEGKIELSDLPKYSGSGNWNDVPSNLKPSSENVKFSAYQVEGANVQDVYDWFKNNMSGWSLEDKQTPINMGENTVSVLIYEKEDTAAGIVIISGPNYPETCYIQGIGPEEVINLNSSGGDNKLGKTLDKASPL